MRWPFRKKTEAKTVETVVKKEASLLEQLCGEDKALYEDLSRSMFLDPRGKGTYEETIKEAEELKNKGNIFHAKVKYLIAASLALYEGNVERVKAAYEALSSLGYRYDAILANPKKAIEIAQNYYKASLKII